MLHAVTDLEEIQNFDNGNIKHQCPTYILITADTNRVCHFTLGMTTSEYINELVINFVVSNKGKIAQIYLSANKYLSVLVSPIILILFIKYLF